MATAVSLTVNFNANGGTDAPSSVKKLGSFNSFPGNLTVFLPSSVPKRVGYAFLGWSTNSSAVSASYQPASSYTYTIHDYQPHVVITLYAVWQQVTVILSFDANGGTNPPSSIATGKGTTITIPSQKPSRSNYTFKNWALTREGVVSTYNPGDSIVVNDNYTLVASWKKAGSTFNQFPVSVLMDGSTQYTITINKSSHVDHHTLLIKLGNREQQFTNVNASVTFSIPLIWCNALPTRTSWDGTVYLTSYNSSGSQVGSVVTRKLLLQVPDSVVPSVSVSASVSGDATAIEWGRYIQGFSSITFAINASGIYSSNIKMIEITGSGFDHKSEYDSSSVTVQLTSGIINSYGDLSFVVRVTDSRGRSSSYTQVVTFDQYFKPSFDVFNAYRSNAQGVADEFAGEYITAMISGVQIACSSDNEFEIDLKWKAYGSQSYTTLQDDASLNMAYTFAASTGGTFIVYARIEDSLGSYYEETITIQSVVGSLSLGLNNDRARFGGAVRKAGLEVDWDSEFHGRVHAANFIQNGRESARSVSAGSADTISITFDSQFSAVPNVIACLYSSQTVGLGDCSCSIYDLTVSGFTLRLENNYSSDRNLGATWIAVL